MRNVLIYSLQILLLVALLPCHLSTLVNAFEKTAGKDGGPEELKWCAHSGQDLDAQKAISHGLGQTATLILRIKKMATQNQMTSQSTSVFYSDSDQNHKDIRREQLQMMLYLCTLPSSNRSFLRDVLEPDVLCLFSKHNLISFP